MAAPHALPLTIAALTDAQPPLRLFYVKADDGLFHLQTDGVHPDTTKLGEFRDNNRSLNALKTELEGKLTAAETARDTVTADLTALREQFKDVDPAEYRVLKSKPDVSGKLTELETALTAERTAHAATQLKATIGAAFMKAGGRPDTLDYLMTKAATVFAMKDGAVTTAAYSPTTPGQALTVPEWITSQQAESAFCFLGSKGAGAGTTGQGGGPPRRVVASNDPYAFGQNLEDIASGKADVR